MYIYFESIVYGASALVMALDKYLNGNTYVFNWYMYLRFEFCISVVHFSFFTCPLPKCPGLQWK